LTICDMWDRNPAAQQSPLCAIASMAAGIAR
jgi:hypothetical protein